MVDTSTDQPSTHQQLEFLRNLQRLFSEGSFVATYKFALLSALADLCVEKGRDDDAELLIETKDIAAKFITYYWRQVIPFAPRRTGNKAFVLSQNAGKQAGVIRVLQSSQQEGIKTLNGLRRQPVAWSQTLNKINRIVKQMPLWKLQTMGSTNVEFLYENVGRGNFIRLKPGVMYCFRAFHTFITDMIRGAWVRFVRQRNHEALGAVADLDEFLFGSERASLRDHASILYEAQSACCFYCGRRVDADERNVDHFVPWSMYPFDLGHNFVLADQRCNAAKAHHLASIEYLERWASRNGQVGEYLSKRFDSKGIVHDLANSQTIAVWAYHQGFVGKVQTYSSGYGTKRTFEDLPQDWAERMEHAQTKYRPTSK